jgi:hypothetical protein
MQSRLGKVVVAIGCVAFLAAVVATIVLMVESVPEEGRLGLLPERSVALSPQRHLLVSTSRPWKIAIPPPVLTAGWDARAD